MNRPHTAAVNRITVVDDEPWVVDVLVRAAKLWNYDCQSAFNAESALQLLERNLTPILVTDIRMPGRDGVWLIEQVRRRWPEVGIIVITAGHDDNLVTRCLDAGAHHYFVKPINFDEFHHALHTTTHQFQVEQETSQYHKYLEEVIRCKTRQIRQTYLSAIDSLVRLLEARDPYTCGHSLRVSKYAVALARHLRLPRKERTRIRLAAKLHDIGKVGVPERILNKIGSLTDAEREFVQKHPVIGERILSSIVHNRTVLAGIRSHHERWDGFGYPDGLAGAEIPRCARLISVADCFDALTSTRSYRRAMSVAESVVILKEGAGSQFDPDFVARFLDVVRQGLLDEVLTRDHSGRDAGRNSS